MDVLNKNREVKAVRGLINIQEKMVGKNVKEDLSTTKNRLRYFYQTILKDSDLEVKKLKGYGLTPYHKDLATISYRWRGQAVRSVKTRIKQLGL